MTYLAISLVGLPTVIMQFLITRSTKQYCYLIIVCAVMLSLPCLYFSGIYGLQQFVNTQTYSTDVLQLVLVLAISIVSVLVTLSVASLVFKQTVYNLTPTLDTTNEKHNQAARPVKKSGLTRGVGSSGSKAVAMILISNPSIIATMLGMKTAKCMTHDVPV